MRKDWWQICVAPVFSWWFVDVGNVMLTAMIWSKSKPDVEFQYGGRLGEFSGMWSHSHLPHSRVLPLGEFTVMIPEPHATLQSVIILSAILKIVCCHILFFLFFFCFKQVWALSLTSGGFRIVYDTLVFTRFDAMNERDKRTDRHRAMAFTRPRYT